MFITVTLTLNNEKKTKPQMCMKIAPRIYNLFSDLSQQIINKVE